MKKLIAPIGVLLLTLMLAGCTDEYQQRIDALQERLAKLQEVCDKLNYDLATLQALVEVIESQDMITGVTEIYSSGTLTGYRINFVQHEPITISNGQDGKMPLVSSRMNPEDKNYYWAVQYGDGTVDWLRAADGSMMLSIGVLPLISLNETDGKFYYTLDGKTWIELGPANGNDGDTMFASIDTHDNYYVTITLSNGEVMKIPTNRAYVELKQEFDKTNANAEAQFELFQTTYDNLVCITRLTPILSGLDTVGLNIDLSSGKTFSIHDWVAATTPLVFIKKDTDGHLYWAYSIGTTLDAWVLSPDGEKLSAENEQVDVPKLSILRADDGQYYWALTSSNGQVEYLRYNVGGEWKPVAIDSVARTFSAINNYTDSLVVVMKDKKTRFVLPKQYTVVISDAGGIPIDQSVSVAPGSETVLSYVAYGNGATLSLIAQGGITAKAVTLEDGGNGILVKAPANFKSGTGKIMAIFSFPSDKTPVTVIKTITVY